MLAEMVRGARRFVGARDTDFDRDVLSSDIDGWVDDSWGTPISGLLYPVINDAEDPEHPHLLSDIRENERAFGRLVQGGNGGRDYKDIDDVFFDRRAWAVLLREQIDNASPSQIASYIAYRAKEIES